MTTAGGQAGQDMTLEERALAGLGACRSRSRGGGCQGDRPCRGALTLSDSGYVFPRIGGTSAGAIVAALVAAYQISGVSLTQIHTDMADLDYTQFMEKLRRNLGLIGMATEFPTHQGLYASAYVDEWLDSKLEPLGIRTFADLKITGDDGTALPPYQRYRLVIHTSDLTRRAWFGCPGTCPRTC